MSWKGLSWSIGNRQQARFWIDNWLEEFGSLLAHAAQEIPGWLQLSPPSCNNDGDVAIRNFSKSGMFFASSAHHLLHGDMIFLSGIIFGNGRIPNE
ncbi:conserved hypothetical protein [Ricinus communis]|uniref:Uncharacterized protein n=1 Tax=Ricinus communis TaxID=3988 RepID=B9T045_RICCO|nr:conserved hypothetical protein [Ricinus communis]